MPGLIKHLRKAVRLTLVAGVAAGSVFICGCTTGGEPRVRLGSYATPTPGTRYLDISDLGEHSYGSSLSENDGIVYTCRGGHIDITHVRIAADYVRYLNDKIRKCLMNSDAEFTFKFNVEPSTYYATLQYPPTWKFLPRKDKEIIADEVAIELSQYCTYTMTTWHEVITWFGYKTVAFWSEEPSAFSWEDIYSNLVGVRLGGQALQDEKHNFDEAMTILLKQELKNLGIQSRDIARQAAEKMKGKWWSGFVQVDMKERNMDIGLDDGFVTPTLVPGICGSAQPQSYPVPTLEKCSKYGFTIDLAVEPREFERWKIFKLVYPNGGEKRIHPSEQLPIVMDFIKKEALAKGYDVMPPAGYMSDVAVQFPGGAQQNQSLYHQP
jgi:hypothetical protein